MSYDATRRRLDALTEHVGFQDLVTILLTRTGVNVRPLGGPGDRGRDAVAGLYRAKGGEPLAVTISLERDWRAKIRADLKRIHDCGFRPKAVISVTNRAGGGAGPGGTASAGQEEVRGRSHDPRAALAGDAASPARQPRPARRVFAPAPTAATLLP